MNQEMICKYVRSCKETITCPHSRFHEHSDVCGLRLCIMKNNEKLAVNCVPRGDLRFKQGDRVIFHRNLNKYNIGENNPLFGTKYFCKGTVLVDGGGRVQWDNGKENSYDPIDLDFAAHYSDSCGQILNPNLIFKFSKKVKHARS